MDEMKSEKMLKKEIGFFGLVAIFVGLNIGGALFSLTNVAVGITGQMSPLTITPDNDKDYLSVIMPIKIKSTDEE